MLAIDWLICPLFIFVILDYAIEGTPASLLSSSDCHFIYRSGSDKDGKLNSPRYPSSYPNDITCTYEMIAQPHEFIMISFDTFNVEAGER